MRTTFQARTPEARPSASTLSACPSAVPACIQDAGPAVQPPTAPPQTFLENVAAVASDKSKADLEAHLRSVQN